MLNFLKRRLGRRFLKRYGLIEAAAAHGRFSFAQEGEDILVWRLLDRGQPIIGTYVDIGSNHPWRHSNSAFFYLKGWSGVAIDPNPDFAAAFAAERPRDVFLNVGISDSTGELSYHRFAEPLYNTFSAEKAAELVKRGINRLRKPVSVEVLTLTDALQRVWPAGKPVDFISIDAEGLDYKILLGHDFAKYPSRLVLVEFESARLRECLLEPMVNLLEGKGYLFVAKLGKSGVFVHQSAVEQLALG